MGSQPTNLKLARSVSFSVANCNSPKVMGHLSAALLALALAGGLGGLADATCAIGGDGSGKVSCQEGSTYSQTCATAIKNHVKLEFSAATQYLVMGAYFGQDNINLHGFSNMFFKHADEERAHGLKFIDYLRMRGNLDEDFFSSLKPIKNKSSWADAEEALRDALEMEKVVTGAMKAMIDQCSEDDFSADWLTGDWLDEQLRGQRELSGMINTFATFRRDYESLADWMFSEQLLKA